MFFVLLPAAVQSYGKIYIVLLVISTDYMDLVYVSAAAGRAADMKRRGIAFGNFGMGQVQSTIRTGYGFHPIRSIGNVLVSW